MKRIVFILLLISGFCQAQIINSYAYTSIGEVELAIAGYIPSSLDTAVTVEGNDLTTWVDVIGDGTHNAISNAGVRPILNISPSGTRQMRGSYNVDMGMEIQNSSTGSIFDFTGTDAWSIRVKLGETTGTGILVGKDISPYQQYDVVLSGTNSKMWNGGDSKVFTWNASEGDVVIATCNGTTRSLYINDVAIFENDSYTATETTTEPLAIGQGGTQSWSYTGDIESVHIYDIALDRAQVTSENGRN